LGCSLAFPCKCTKHTLYVQYRNFI
jgi:hypothetical protein